MPRDIRYVNALDFLSWDEGLPICDCCTQRLATIRYDCDNLCQGCVNYLTALGNPVAQYATAITPRPPAY